MEYTYNLSNKPIPSVMKFHDLLASSIPSFIGINMHGQQTTIILNQEPTVETITLIESLVPPAALNTQEYVQKVISNSILFGQKLISEFAAENVIMGITQDGMTGTVRKNMAEVINALQTGSLYDVISEVKAIPADKKDSKYITDARLLQFVNKIEDYLGIPRSTSL